MDTHEVSQRGREELAHFLKRQGTVAARHGDGVAQVACGLRRIEAAQHVADEQKGLEVIRFEVEGALRGGHREIRPAARQVDVREADEVLGVQGIREQQVEEMLLRVGAAARAVAVEEFDLAQPPWRFAAERAAEYPARDGTQGQVVQIRRGPRAAGAAAVAAEVADEGDLRCTATILRHEHGADVVEVPCAAGRAGELLWILPPAVAAEVEVPAHLCDEPPWEHTRPRRIPSGVGSGQDSQEGRMAALASVVHVPMHLATF